MSPDNYGSKPTIECFRKAFATHGLPQICVSDNGPSFTSTELALFMKMNGIRHVESAPYHPSTNGSAERAVQSFKSAMKKMDSSPSTESIHTRLDRFPFAYRTTLQTTTGKSPAELLMNQRLSTALSLVKPDLQRKVTLRQQSFVSEDSPNVRSFVTGDQVWMRNYHSAREKWISGTVEHKTGPLSYQIRVGDQTHRRNVDQMRRSSNATVEEMTVPMEEPVQGRNVAKPNTHFPRGGEHCS